VFLKNKNFVFLFPLIFAMPLMGPSCSVNKNDGGAYKTFDEGKSWKQVATIEENTKEDLTTSDATKLVSDPFNSDVVFLVTKEKGLYVSKTYGDTWKRILPETATVYDLSADPFTKGHLYASVLLNERGKIIESTNGGTDWNEIYTEAGVGTYITHLKADPFLQNSLSAVNSEGLLIRSLDKGVTWKPMFPFNEALSAFIMDEQAPGSFWALSQKGLWQSQNGGLDFTLLELDPEMGYRFLLLQKEKNNLFLGTEKGLFRSTDNAKTWEKIVTLNNPEEFPVNAITFFPNSPGKFTIGAGMTLYITRDNGQTFQAIQFDLSREVTSILIKPDNPAQILVGVKLVAKNKIGF